MVNYIGFKAMDMGFDAHLTVLYTGELDEEQTVKVKDVLHSLNSVKSYVERDRIKLFGYTNLPVVTVAYDPDLPLLREHLIDAGCPNPSTFDWNPHITLKLNHAGTIHIPRYIKLVDLGLY